MTEALILLETYIAAFGYSFEIGMKYKLNPVTNGGDFVALNPLSEQ